MSSRRGHFVEFIEQGLIPGDRIEPALTTARIRPDGLAWLRFADRLLLSLGCLALAIAVLFFIAHNWNGIDRFTKFAGVQALMVAAVGAYCYLGPERLAAKISLLVSAILAGVLLALFGQVYQTGADPWQLFFSWALLILPWALAGRFPALWLLWLALVNMAVVLYCEVFRGVFWLALGADEDMLWLLFGINTLALAIWEWQARARPWLSERWAIRLVAIGGGVPMTLLGFEGVLGNEAGEFLGVLVWMAWLAALYAVYRRMFPDLFMLAGCCLSVIVVVVTLAGRFLLHHDFAGGFLLIALLVIGLGGGAAIWLRGLHQEWET